MSTAVYYSLNQFKEWIVQSTTSYELQPDVLNVIKYLEKTIEIPDMSQMNTHTHVPNRTHTSSAPNFQRPSYGSQSRQSPLDMRTRPSMDPTRKQTRPMNNDRYSMNQQGNAGGRNHKSSPTLEDWETTRNFKTTKFETKTGVEKQINDIRIVLNKISTSNYEKQRDIILGHIREFFSYDSEDPAERDENIKKISSAIFDIASSNKFFSELYAQLYKELIDEFDIFGTIIDSFIAGFNDTIATIQYVDPDVNYDEFCRINKVNDKRKATAAFIVNLMKKSVIPMDTITEIIHVFMQHILSYIKETDKGKEVEEITETLFILITNCKTELLTHPKWIQDIYPHIKVLSSTEAKKSNPSISNRVIFKFMDLV